MEDIKKETLNSNEEKNTNTTENEITEELISSENIDQLVEELKEEVEEASEEKKEVSSESAKPLENNKSVSDEVKKYKLFFVTDLDKEAVYLHEMSKKGLHFVKRNGIQYLFKKGEEKDYYYHLGYYEKDLRDEEQYVKNYADAGWELIYHEKGEFDGVWNYFRIETEEEPHIFSDRVSRIALYKRLLESWRSLLTMFVICFLFVLGFYSFLLLRVNPSTVTTVSLWVAGIFLVLIAISFAVYLKLYKNIEKKLDELLKH